MIRFTVEVEENSILRSIPSLSDPMQLCPFREEIRQDFLLFPACPILVHLGCSDAEKGAQGSYVPILTKQVAHCSDVGCMGPRSPLVFVKDARHYRERWVLYEK